MQIVVIGPGQSSLAYKETLQNTKIKTLAFQEVFPNCVDKLGVVPDYWLCGDPHAYLNGFREMLAENTEKYEGIKILIPSHYRGDLVEYRRHCGTTPLMRMEDGWGIFKDLLSSIEKRYEVQYIEATTTKNIKLYPSGFPDEDIFSNDAYYRFMHPQVIYGSIEFDSESVIGTKYLWGMENKLSTHVLPTCFYLGVKEVYVVGFDMQGERFYSSVARVPWNDESQITDEVRIPLKILEKWIQWRELHGMKIKSLASDEYTKINSVIEYVSEDEIL